MENLEPQGGTSREELLERMALMESMIREGRRATGRYGWCFVLWGIVDLAGLALQWEMPHARWVWPVTILAGFAIQGLLLARMRRLGRFANRSSQSRNVGAVWGMMGLTALLYVVATILARHAWQISYIAAILMMVGMAHAISAAILRWPVQAAAAALWLGSGVAIQFIQGPALLGVVVADMVLGLVVFGLYVMVLERRNGSGAVASHA